MEKGWRGGGNWLFFFFSGPTRCFHSEILQLPQFKGKSPGAGAEMTKAPSLTVSHCILAHCILGYPFPQERKPINFCNTPSNDPMPPPPDFTKQHLEANPPPNVCVCVPGTAALGAVPPQPLLSAYYSGGTRARCGFKCRPPPFPNADNFDEWVFVRMVCNGACFGVSRGVREALIRSQRLICRSMPWHTRLSPLPKSPFVPHRLLLMPDGRGKC